MAEWKKIVVSGSAISQLNNDAGYVAAVGAGIVSSSAQIKAGLPTGVISGSAQLPSGVISGSAQLPSGIISGSGQLPSNIVSSSTQTIAFLPEGTVSGSSQVAFGSLNGLPSGLISGSGQVNLAQASGKAATAGTADTASYVAAANIDGEITADAVDFGGIANFPSGVVSGSSQVNANTITNFDSNVKAKMNSDGVISGSAQLPSGIISGS